MKRPLIPVALLYIGGILLAAFPVPLLPLFVIAVVLVFLFVLWARARLVLLCVLIVMTGWINLARRTAVLSPHDLRSLPGQQTVPAGLRGTLRETPYHRVHKSLSTGQDIWSTHAEIEVTHIQLHDGDWQPASGRVATTTPGIMPDKFFAGQQIEVGGALGPARGPVAEGLFDYRAFLAHQGIYYEMPVKNIAEWQILSSPPLPPLADRFCAWARKTLARGLPVEDESLRLEWALTLGWKAALTDEVAEPFMRAATYHIFAVDGLRIAIISAIFFGLFRAVGVPRAFCGVLLAPLLFFYAAMTGWPASAIRALVMIMVIFGGWALKRPSDLVNSLFAAALIILLWEPRQLFQAGFQLSFFVVLCIVLILPFFKNIGERVLRPDPLLPESLRPRWQKILRPPAVWLADLFLTSTAAWLGSIPLVAYYFHLFTPLSGPANVLAVPLCGLVLICNLSSLLLGAWLPIGAELFNHAGWFFMEAIRTTSHWSANWPGAWFYLPMPGLFTIAVYYLVLLAVLTGWLFQGRLRRWKISGCVILIAIWFGGWLWQLPVTKVTVLPLNGGHAVYVQSPGARNDWLIDSGSIFAADGVIKPFLRAQGVSRLPHFVLTHGESSFSGGAQYLCELFRPREVFLNPLHFRSPDYNKFTACIRTNHILQMPVQPGDQLGPLRVLYPGPDIHFAKADDNALVLRLEIHGVRILLLSDLGHAGQNALLAQDTNELRADIVVAGIPGENEPLSDFLLDAIQPRVVILADSDYSGVRKARPKLLERLSHRNVPVLRTCDTSAITVTIRSGVWKLRTMEGVVITASDLPVSVSTEPVPQ